MLGLAPAVHPTIGMWCFIITALALLWDYKTLGSLIRDTGLSFLFGVLLSAISLGYQQWAVRGITWPDVTRSSQAEYLNAFVAFWDSHRQAVSAEQYRGLTLALAMLICGALGVWGLHRHLPSPSLFLLRIAVIGSVAGLLGCQLTHYHDALPRLFIQVMPGRFINLMIMAYPALLIGLIGAYRRRTLAWGLLAAVVGGVAIGRFRSWLPWAAGWHTIWTVLTLQRKVAL